MNPSDQCWTSLREDIIVAEILPRLPFKQLFRLKCVSKLFDSIISNPKFARSYLQRAFSSSKSGSSSCLLSSFLFPLTDVPPDYNIKNLTDTVIDSSCRRSVCLSSVSLPHDNKSHKILGSSNGLILSLFHPDENQLRFGLCVSNPLTKQGVRLPGSLLTDFRESDEFAIATRRVRDASAFLSYRIVIIRHVYDNFLPHGYVNTIIQIFSSDTGSWDFRKLICPSDLLNRDTLTAGFAYKGVLHWLGRTTGAVITYDPFDSPDRFGGIQLPEGEYSDSCLVYSGEQEMVKYCEIYNFQPVHREKRVVNNRMSVWRLVDSDKGEWFLERECVLGSLPKCCMPLLVAPNPRNRRLLCYPQVIKNAFKAIDSRKGSWKFVRVVVGAKPEDMLSFFDQPLRLIETCPWSSPFYTRASKGMRFGIGLC